MMRMLSEEESKDFLEKHKPKADLDEMITLITGLYRKECDHGIDPVLTRYQTEELLVLLNDYKQLKQSAEKSGMEVIKE